MSTPAKTDPTIQDITDIGTAGAQAVDPAVQTPAEATVAVKAAVEERARELKVTLDSEAVDAIGNSMIGKLEAMGAFRKPEPVNPPTAEEEGAAAAGGTGTAAATPPEKKTLAQRLLS